LQVVIYCPDKGGLLFAGSFKKPAGIVEYIAGGQRLKPVAGGSKVMVHASAVYQPQNYVKKACRKGLAAPSGFSAGQAADDIGSDNNLEQA
jgi:hypothetical protein